MISGVNRPRNIRLRDIWRVSQKRPLFQRLFMSVRFVTVPWNEIFNYIPDKTNALDYGCGHGIAELIAGHMNPEIKIDAYDHDTQKIESNKKASISRMIKFTDDDSDLQKKYELIMVNDVLYSQEQSKVEETILHLYNRMNLGSRLVIKECVSGLGFKSFVTKAQELLAVFVFKFTKGNRVAMRSAKEYREIFKNAGLRVLMERQIDQGYIHSHYLFICEK